MNKGESVRGKKKRKSTPSLRGLGTKQVKAEKKIDVSQKKKRKLTVEESGKRSKEDHKRDDDDDDDREEHLRPIPPYMKGISVEQKAAYEKFARHIFSQGVEGLLKEYIEQLKGYVGQPAARAVFDQNPTKNRYKDVVCNDLTRVVITDGKFPDYIHANYVKGEPLFNEFICTQGPMATTKDDFWRMICYLKVGYIVMLCETVEMGKIKCEQYWPLQKGEKMTYGDIVVEHTSQNTKDTQVTVTKLTVTLGSEKLIVRHLHWKTWPDRSIPKSSKAVLRILRYVRYSPRPIVVHCSAGIGRTGTFVAVEMCLQSILKTGNLSLIDVCKRLRDQRQGVLQVDIQFVYLALAVLEFGKAIGYFGESVELVEEFNKFKANIEAVVAKREETATTPTPEKSTPHPINTKLSAKLMKPSKEKCHSPSVFILGSKETPK